MKFIHTILNLFLGQPKPVYGEKIFQQQTWMDKQVQESLHKRTFNLD